MKGRKEGGGGGRKKKWIRICRPNSWTSRGRRRGGRKCHFKCAKERFANPSANRADQVSRGMQKGEKERERERENGISCLLGVHGCRCKIICGCLCLHLILQYFVIRLFLKLITYLGVKIIGMAGGKKIVRGCIFAIRESSRYISTIS